MTGESILVVEDDGLIALHLKEVLEKAGHRVNGLAYSGEMVLQALEESPKPDLILMDIGLAGSLDGIDTALEIKKRFSIPLIFLTAYTSERTLERMNEVAPEGYLVKPFLDQELLDIAEKAVSRSNGDKTQFIETA